MKVRRRLPSPGLIVAAIALVAALGGSAIALPGSGQVGSNDIKRGAVKTQALHHRAVTTQKLQRQAVRGGKLARNAVKSGKLRDDAVISRTIAPNAVTDAKIADGAVGGAKIADDSIPDTKLQDQSVIGLQRVAATGGADFDAARTAAAPAELFKRGDLTVYAKCFTDGSSDTTYAYTYAATTAPNALLVSGEDDLVGDPFLDPGTPEVDREIYTEDTGNDSSQGFRNQFALSSANGTALHGMLAVYAKNGALSGGNGAYGDGDACLFSGTIFG